MWMRVSKDGTWWISGYKAILIPIEGSVLDSSGKWSMMEDSWPLPTLRRYSVYGLERGSTQNLMLFMRVKTCTWHHKTEHERAAKMITAQEPLDTIGGHYRKSPLKTTILLPKGEYGRCMMSRKVSFTTSAQCQCCAKISSQMINFASWSKLAELFYTHIKHIESLPMAIGIFKIECEVRPPSNRKAVMPEEATLMATCLSCQTDANNTLYTKVFLDPPRLSRKNTTPSP